MHGETEQKFTRPRNVSDATAFNQMIRRTKPSSDMWTSAFGNDIAGLMASGSGFYVSYYFRKALKLRPHARITCYAPVMGLAAFGSYIFHAEVITSQVLANKTCPLCVTVNASLGQLAFGTIYPLILSPIIAFFVADKLLTYPVPPLVRAPKEVYQLWLKLVKTNFRPFLILAAFQVFAVSFITYEKQKSIEELGSAPKKI